MCSLHDTPTIYFQRLHEAAVLPVKAHASDACFDLVAVSSSVHEDYIEYSLGFATAIPEGWQALVYPRSSISNYNLALCNSVGIIDADYRGEWKVRFRQTLKERQKYAGISDLVGGWKSYKIGDKVAQVQFQRVPTVDFHEVPELPASTRGAGGFGSTGR